MKFEERYSCIGEGPEPEEIVLLMGRGCFWKKCSFCDYHIDKGPDAVAIPLNARVLEQVTGAYQRLVVLNSGSYFELPAETRQAVFALCKKKGIQHLHMESHWQMHMKVEALKAALEKEGITLHPRIGIETFDEDFREERMVKGMGRGLTPEKIASVFDECCLLYGMKGQNQETFVEDVRIARHYFNRIYINIFNDNSTVVKADRQLIAQFKKELQSTLTEDPKICILINNTDLGVGD